MTEDIHYQVKRFRDAVYRLSQPRMAMFDQEVLHRPGLYDEIREAMAGEEQGQARLHLPLGPAGVDRSPRMAVRGRLGDLLLGFAIAHQVRGHAHRGMGAEYVKEVAFYADVVERWVAEGRRC